MIRVEFDHDETEINRLRRSDVLGIPWTAIEQTCLILPVRFVVGDLDLLYRETGATDVAWLVGPAGAIQEKRAIPSVFDQLHTPIIGFSGSFSEAAREVCVEPESIFEMPEDGSIILTCLGDEVRLSSTFTRRNAVASAEAIREAAVDLHGRVVQFVGRELPELLSHPGWPRWAERDRDRPTPVDS